MTVGTQTVLGKILHITSKFLLKANYGSLQTGTAKDVA